MIDWSKVPEGATHYNNNNGFFYRQTGDKLELYKRFKWCESAFTVGDADDKMFTPRPKEWPTDEQRIDVIGTNGNDGSHYVDNTATTNKYDRTIIGKYGTGSVTVDVYRVLNAFGPLSPEIDHSVKKLLAAGTRGAKSERQDLLEAIQSIEARVQYLEARDGDKQ